MIYVQGFFHLDECTRAKAPYAPCYCDQLALKAKALAAVTSQSALAAEVAPELVGE